VPTSGVVFFSLTQRPLQRFACLINVIIFTPCLLQPPLTPKI
jgi:hypothetical protein